MDNAGNNLYQIADIIRWLEGRDFSVCMGDGYLIIFLTYAIKNY